jgi:hypothetical protein
LKHSRLPDLPEIEGLDLATQRYPHHPDTLRLRRAVVDYLEVWGDCSRAACRNAGGCRSRAVVCFDEQRPTIAEVMIGFLYEGYANEDGEEF